MVYTEIAPTSFEIKVPTFEGPLDLLLHLIYENQMNIYDIPIAQITRQYLEALHVMRSLNLAVAGDFLVMAATLILIKSKTLLPPDPTNEEEVEESGEDPRHELVLRLLEYKKYKEAAGELENRESLWRQIFFRKPSDLPRTEEMLIGDITSLDLLEALKAIMERLPEQEGFVIAPDTLSVRDQIHFILSRLEISATLLFDQIFEGARTRADVVVTFLALLEMVRMGLLRVIQTETLAPLRLLRMPDDVAPEERDVSRHGGEDGRL